MPLRPGRRRTTHPGMLRAHSPLPRFAAAAQGTLGVAVLQAAHAIPLGRKAGARLGSSPDLLGSVQPEGDLGEPPPRHHFRRPHGERAALPETELGAARQPRAEARGPNSGGRGGAGCYHASPGGGGTESSSPATAGVGAPSFPQSAARGPAWRHGG